MYQDIVFSDDDDMEDDLDLIINSRTWESDDEDCANENASDDDVDLDDDTVCDDDIGSDSVLESLLKSVDSPNQSVRSHDEPVSSSVDSPHVHQPEVDVFGRTTEKHRSAWKNRMQTYGGNFSFATGAELVSPKPVSTNFYTSSTSNYVKNLYKKDVFIDDIAQGHSDDIKMGSQYTVDDNTNMWILQTGPEQVNELTTLDIQSTICAALNSRQKLTWLIGVDADGVVRGVYLPRTKRDIMQQSFDYAISTEFLPILSSSHANIRFVPVCDEDDSEIYVIEISVDHIVDELYQLSSGRVYVNSGGVPTLVESINTARNMLVSAQSPAICQSPASDVLASKPDEATHTSHFVLALGSALLFGVGIGKFLIS